MCDQLNVQRFPAPSTPHPTRSRRRMCDQPKDDWYWSTSRIDPPSTVTVWPDGNPEVGRLLGPDGRLARIVRAKPERAIGFKPDRE